MTVLQQIKEANIEKLTELILEISEDGLERLDRVVCRTCEYGKVTNNTKVVGCVLINEGNNCIFSDKEVVRKWLESETEI